MPLRDHFRPPLDNVTSWEALHGGWPMVIVQQLRARLPEGYVAQPRMHLGSRVEIDVGAFEKSQPAPITESRRNGGVSTAVWAPPAPSVAVETEPPDYDEYEVRVYDDRRGQRLVAAVEIVSPANKNRPESRNAFIAKCAALIQKGVAVDIVDLVTIRQFNLYASVLTFVGHSDPTMGSEAPPLYAASCRWVRRGEKAFFEAWSQALSVGQPLPTLPLWLSDVRVVPLDLEESYEKACYDLSIP